MKTLTLLALVVLALSLTGAPRSSCAQGFCTSATCDAASGWGCGASCTCRSTAPTQPGVCVPN